MQEYHGVTVVGGEKSIEEWKAKKESHNNQLSLCVCVCGGGSLEGDLRGSSICFCSLVPPALGQQLYCR